jgi:hypothetical protein
VAGARGQLLRDFDAFRQFISGSGMHAIFDLPPSTGACAARLAFRTTVSTQREWSMGARARKEKSSIKLSERRSQPSPRADASVEHGSRISLSAEDFDRFEKCMTSEASPSRAMLEGMALHQVLTTKR